MEKTVSPLFLGCFSSVPFHTYLQVTTTCMRARRSLRNFIEIWLDPTTGVMMGKEWCLHFFRLFFIRSFSYLQVTVACMIARTSSNFSLIGPPTAELAALEPLTLFILASNNDIHKSLEEFEILPDLPSDHKFSCPLASKNRCFYIFSFAIYLIHFKFVGIKGMHNTY